MNRQRDYNDRPAPNAAEESAAQDAAESAAIAEIEDLERTIQRNEKDQPK